MILLSSGNSLSLTCGRVGPGLEQMIHEGLEAWQVALQLLLFHPVVVEVGVAGPRCAERHPEERIVGGVRQVYEGMSTVLVFPVGQPLAE